MGWLTILYNPTTIFVNRSKINDFANKSCGNYNQNRYFSFFCNSTGFVAISRYGLCVCCWALWKIWCAHVFARPWMRHGMKTFSELLARCELNQSWFQSENFMSGVFLLLEQPSSQLYWPVLKCCFTIIENSTIKVKRVYIIWLSIHEPTVFILKIGPWIYDARVTSHTSLGSSSRGFPDASISSPSPDPLFWLTAAVSAPNSLFFRLPADTDQDTARMSNAATRIFIVAEVTNRKL